MAMTKRDLVMKISEDTGLIQKDVAKVVQMTLDGFSDALANGETLELRNFGVFEVVTRKSRIGRNPRRPEKEVVIPARSMVKFRSGRALKARVGKLDPSDI